MSNKFIRIEEEQYLKLTDIAKKNKRSIKQQLEFILDDALNNNEE